MLKKNIVQEVLNYIENNIDVNINIDDISRFTGYSRRHIQTIFKQHVRIPLGLYIRKRRVTRASIFLRLTNMNVIDISAKFGYDSQQSFCREFKKAAGLTPLQYRRSSCWDFSPLQAEFNFNRIDVGSFQICTLPEGYVSGQMSHQEIAIPANENILEVRWNTIINHLNNQKQNIWSISEYKAHKKHSMRIKLSSIIGVHNKEVNKKPGDHTYPSGIYARFSFRCNKEEYSKYSKHIYLNIFPKHRLKRRPAPDIEVFTYNGYARPENALDCEYYIPVETVAE
ncbi:helix-turn-helix domain-containing protein [Buttiauxella sp. S04-F03]|uniref:helix-turn-helix domain-containing protein n=1 Tax=Buttiauxella sp. W03-F01 TaxID=2904524 RepID=UPI001E585D86|nr:helix-turn-helix domain-containing protein [Buttiauxella sp. W03-F01]MCE0801756.1 helix-turn-helix domain-containing protein [Buttiauxella sp. W03-F01]